MILSRKQLEDIKSCEDHKCSECSYEDDCECNAKSVVAQAALELMDEMAKYKDMLKRLEWRGDFSCHVCRKNAEEGHTEDCELAVLLRESEGKS